MRRVWGLPLALLSGWLVASAAELNLPAVALAGVPIPVSGRDFPPNTPLTLRFTNVQGATVATLSFQTDAQGALEHPVRLGQTGGL
ncbi:MAG: hypothetical protein P3X24_001575, partial [bacterium]|nr:hypothetical protein [bacterium]